VVNGQDLPALSRHVAGAHVDPSLETYILNLVRHTRRHPDLLLGASPRGSLALYKTAQALAALRHRDYVTPDDIKTLAPAVLTHRLLLKPESRLRGRTPHTVISDALLQTEVDVGQIA
ncbi:MAG: AAA family ATPase, partial [Anaerolineae bacterium]